MSESYAQWVLKKLPRQVRDKFAYRIVGADNPDFKKVAEYWQFQLWIEPKHIASPVLIFPCEFDLTWDYDEPELWFLDRQSAMLRQINWLSFNYYVDDVLRRFAVEDLVEYTILYKTLFGKIRYLLTGHQKSRGELTTFRFESDLPPKQWGVVEVQRYPHW